MGNADSKAIDEHESTVVTNSVVTKQSQQITEYSTGAAAAAAAGDAEGASSRRTPEKRESEKNNLRRNGSGGSGREDNGSESAPPPMKVSDDQVNVNMPMADLMAYLQVVANNSGNLPLTRRDDPELDRTVSSLSPQDYAKKSAAFVPADVRVISGHFTRYGRVWDLPTSEEYNASDGAHEPGRSYGGACCNTLLKVVYDAANEMDGAAQKAAASEALFEDDEEEEEESAYMGKSSKSGYSLEHVGAQACLISWAHMLRQMKSEFKEVGYPQVPKITTSRKIDLSKPFSLTPEGFNPRKGKKRSLLIGCNYRNDEGAELKASHDDIRSMKDYIVNVHGFSEDSDVMTVLLDDEIHTPPTFMNIVEAFKKLSEESQPGDAVFVQFSGHGGRVLDSAVDSEAESYDEVIVPSDYHHTGLIRDTLIFKTLLAPMRYGVTLTILIDCCDNGMVMELPYAWNSKSDKRGSNPKVSVNDDFSFVRFLKVVKTLYESSTFTQLGKTIGAAQDPLAASTGQSKSDRKGRKGSKGRSRKEELSTEDIGPGESSIFDALTDVCGHKVQEDVCSTVHKENGKSATGANDAIQRSGNETLFDHVVRSCAHLVGPEDEFLSDDETFKTRTDDDGSFCSGVDESFETMTEDDYESRRARRSRRRR